MPQKIHKQSSNGRGDHEPDQPLGIQSPSGQPYARPTGLSVYGPDESLGDIDKVLSRIESQATENQSGRSTSPHSADALGVAEKGATVDSNRNTPPFDQLGKGYTASPPTKKGTMLRGKKLRRWGIGMLLSLTVGVSGMGIFNIASGPLEDIHFAKILQHAHFSGDEDFMDNQFGQLIRYARTADAPERRNLGFYGNAFADHYEKKLKSAGITPGYEGGRIKTLTVDTKTEEGQRAIESLRNQGIDASNLKPNASGTVTVNIDRGGIGSARFRRVAISGMVGTLNMSGLNTAMSSRLLKARAGVDLHPFKNIIRAIDEKIKDYVRKRRDERAERIKNGVKPAAQTVTASANDDKNDANAGTDNSTANDAASEANDILGDSASPNETVQQRSARIRAKLAAGVGVTGFLTTVCGVQALGNAVADQQQSNITLPLMRIGMGVVAMGNQLMAGIDLNADEVGAYHGDLYDETTKTSWTDARSIQAELGEKQTGPDMPDVAKPGNNEKPAFFKKLDSTLGAIPGANTFCKAVSSTVGGWILTAAGIAAVATGPVSLIVNAASEAAQSMLSAAFIDDLVRWLAGEMVDTHPVGALLGNYANYGVRLAANDVALTHGGRELSDSEESQLAFERNQIDDVTNSQKSFYARYLDLNNTNSVAAKALFETPELSNPQAAKMAIVRLPSAILSSITAPFTDLLSGKVSAATPQKYDYGFPKIGYSLNEIDNEGNQNPYERARAVEPKLADLNDKYGHCFNITVDPTTFQLISGEAKRYDQIDGECKDKNNRELTQYRFYIADMVAAKAAACYDNLDNEACQEIGL